MQGVMAVGAGLTGAAELVKKLVGEGVLDLVCVWGDLGDALEALGNLFEALEGL